MTTARLRSHHRLSLFFLMLLPAISGLAEEFVHNFDMDGDYAQYLHRVEGMRVWTEVVRGNARPARYWGPRNTDVPGVLVYRYVFKKPIQSASIRANLLTNTSTDKVSMEVSSTATDYVLITNTSQHPAIYPPYQVTEFDLTPTVLGKTSVFIRVTLQGTRRDYTIASCQFLRTAKDLPHFKAPHVYEFKATLSDE